MHKQMRTRIRAFESDGTGEPGEGSLEHLLTVIGDPQRPGPTWNLCIAGFSPDDPTLFVSAVDHPDGDDRPVDECFEAVARHFSVELVDADVAVLDNEPGGLLGVLRAKGALSAREILIGETGEGRLIVHVRT